MRHKDWRDQEREERLREERLMRDRLIPEKPRIARTGHRYAKRKKQAPEDKKLRTIKALAAREQNDKTDMNFFICKPVVLAHVPNNLYILYEHYLMLESKYNLQNMAHLIGIEEWPEVRRITELWLTDYAARKQTRHLLEREAQAIIDNL